MICQVIYTTLSVISLILYYYAIYRIDIKQYAMYVYGNITMLSIIFLYMIVVWNIYLYME